MKKKNVLIQGALILTLAGFITRIIGFFYRIFLSQTIGAEGMGIYQLIFPVYAMCFSITAAGIQTAISRFVAGKISLNDERSAKNILITGMSISIFLSFIASYVVYHYSDMIAIRILDEPRCADLLKILSFTIPFGAIHSCVNGYYYGIKKTNVPAISQLIEQTIRVFASYMVYLILKDNGQTPTPAIAVIGIVAGEFVSMLFTVTMITGHFYSRNLPRGNKSSYIQHGRSILALSIPLTANRILINILQSYEAIIIPARLRKFGYDTAESLSVYGVLNGMALPLILFPSAITNSVAVLLLPTIAEAQAAGNHRMIAKTIENTIKYCLLLGILCTGVFLSFGDEMGSLIFHNELAGKFILILGWICPFLYMTTTLTSVLNGLGKTASSFVHNCIGLGIRILFVLIFVPKFGIIGYLWGLLTSELVITIFCITSIYKYIKITFPLDTWVVKPLIILFISIGATFFIQHLLTFSAFPELFQLGLAFIFFCIIYCILLIVTGIITFKTIHDIINQNKKK